MRSANEHAVASPAAVELMPAGVALPASSAQVARNATPSPLLLRATGALLPSWAAARERRRAWCRQSDRDAGGMQDAPTVGDYFEPTESSRVRIPARCAR